MNLCTWKVYRNSGSVKSPVINIILADKDRELGDAHAEIKALKQTERAREKAFEEVLTAFFLFSYVFL